MAPSDVTKFLIPTLGHSSSPSDSTTSFSRRQPSNPSPPPTPSVEAAPPRKLSLNRRKRPIPADSISTYESSFDAEVKRARLSFYSPACPSDEPVLQSDMNGHKSLESRFGSSAGSVSSKTPKSPPVASLCNLGNTCFLNSVLYTLRFTPGFLHSLHHMVHDLGLNGNGGKGSKRSNGVPTQQSQQTNGSTNSISDAETELVHDVIDQLHELFRTLSGSDDSDSKEPLPPSNFLSAVGKLNPMFEGNQQQDAHELLGYILNLLQEIKIPAVSAPVTEPNDENKVGNVPEKPEPVNDKKVKKKSAKPTFLSSSNSNLGPNVISAAPTQNGSSSKAPPPPAPKVEVSLPNFVGGNFVGKSVMGTRCLECETSTYRSETFTNIDIPLTFEDGGGTVSVKDLFLREIMASETLRENNKYWCAECSRLNEAQRSVQYELLPRIMVLQLKRFTATGNKNYMSKINDYIPTPLTMNCFCTECINVGVKEQPKHHYRLYAVIMHLGATLASGHYIAYVRASDASGDYLNCQRNSTVERKNKKGILKYFSRSSDGGKGSLSNSGNISGMSSSNGGLPSSAESSVCRSLNCCGIRTLGQLSCPEPAGGHSSLPPIGPASERNSIIHHHHHAQYTQSSAADMNPDLMVMMPNGAGGPLASKNGTSGSLASYTSSSEIDDVWLECDDDSISVITRKQFEEELSSKQSATTPYLLFYQRI